MMTDDLKKNLKDKATWERFLYLALFLFVFTLIQSIVFFVTIVQFIVVLVSGKPNVNLQSVGLHLTNYLSQVMFFLTYNSDEGEKPFPFGPWPVRNRYRSNLPKQ